MFQKENYRESLQQLHNIARENNYSLLDATRHALIPTCLVENTRKFRPLS